MTTYHLAVKAKPVDVAAFLAIERALGDRLTKRAGPYLRAVLRQIKRHLKREEWDKAIGVAKAVDLTFLVDKERKALKTFGNSAVAFGISRLSDLTEGNHVDLGTVAQDVEKMVILTGKGITQNTAQMVRDILLQMITGEQDKQHLESVQKANPYHDERGRFTTHDKATFVSIGVGNPRNHHTPQTGPLKAATDLLEREGATFVVKDTGAIKAEHGVEAVAFYDPNTDSFVLNSDVMGSSKIYDTYMDNAIAKGYHPEAARHHEYIIHHEITHRKYPTGAFGLTLRDKKLQKRVEEYVVSVGGAIGVRKEIGEYAASAMPELFAEARAMKKVGAVLTPGLSKLLKGVD